ncbi:hypothetical protein EDC56_1283 [Sinobacterium caligoides]|uniref:LysB family phage lysis regulatory protein n=1 Tax=Sinobacterium caligoides TaxID=933926 RepID=A0A3N2E1C6_9GAMM|nr:hypothetical protein [Sinobacterium caligoides]ROS05732.1 hypothetical protein EDC56_1283 [Sinobacterium caligoides]
MGNRIIPTILLLAALVSHSAVYIAGKAVQHASDINAETKRQNEIEAMARRDQEKLSRQLNAAIASLAAEQLKKQQVKTKEVIKYVDKYHKALPNTRDCINRSGLLKLNNVTTPTLPAATSRSNGATTITSKI